MKNIKEILKQIERIEDIKIEAQLKRFFKREEWNEIIEDIIKEELEGKDLEDSDELKNEYEEKIEDNLKDELVKYFKEELAEERLEELKKRIEEKGYKFFTIEIDGYFKDDYKETDSDAGVDNIEEALENFENELYNAQVEANAHQNRHYIVNLVGFKDKDQEDFDDDNMEYLLVTEIFKEM